MADTKHPGDDLVRRAREAATDAAVLCAELDERRRRAAELTERLTEARGERWYRRYEESFRRYLDALPSLPLDREP